MATWKVIYWLIPLVVFVILAVFYPNLLEQLKSALGGAVGWVDKQVTFGAEEVSADEIPVPKQLVEAYESLYGALEKGNSVQRNRCLLTYKDFPEFEGFIISIDFIQDKMVMNLKTDKGVVLTSYRKEIPQLKPCLVAGKAGSVFHPEAAPNFFNNWIRPRSGQLRIPEYNTFADGLIITDKETLWAAGQKYSLDDEGLLYFNNEPIILLYKAAPDAVCFLPTHDGDSTCDDEADESGLDDDCLKELLPTKTFAKFPVPLCSSP